MATGVSNGPAGSPWVVLIIDLALAIGAAGAAWGFLQGRLKTLERDNAELRQWKREHDTAAVETAATLARIDTTVKASAEDIAEVKSDVREIKRNGNGGH